MVSGMSCGSPFDPLDIRMRSGQGTFCVLEPGVGRIRCFDTNGKVLWSTGDLGTVHDVVWMGDRVYALAYPEPATGPHVITVVLQDIRLSDGRLTSHKVELPEGAHWEQFAGTINPSSANLIKAGTTVCVSYVVYDNVTGHDVQLLAVPADQEGFRSTFRDWTTYAIVVGDTLAYLTQQGQWALAAYDIGTGDPLWRIDEDTEFGRTSAFVTAAGGVIILCDGAGDWSRARGLDPQTGAVLWTSFLPILPDQSIALAEDVIVGYGNRALRLDSQGETKWDLLLEAPFDVLSHDEPSDRLNIAVNLHGGGVDGITVRLSEGVVLDHARGQAAYRHLTQNHPVPRIQRTAGDSWKVLVYLEGPCVHIADPIYVKQDAGVFARKDFVVTGCTVEPGKVKIHILRPKGSPQ